MTRPVKLESVEEMSWIKEDRKKSWFQRFCCRVLKAGPVPKHVAFIMDGNRRFAKKNSMDKAKGHMMGFEKLAETLEWCSDLGIIEVTVYAFSIENFKRSKEEVDCLMEIAREKFAKLLEEREMLNKYGVRIRMLGNLTLLPRDIQEVIAQAMEMTKANNKATLNVCFSYTSRDEICSAMRECVEGVQLEIIKESDISESVMEQCLFTSSSPDPDLLVRTSGEVRLSDFLLWQSAYSVLSFMTVLWPEFSVWHLYAGILHYQRNYQAVQDAKNANLLERERLQKQSDYEQVLQEASHNRNNGTTAKSAILVERLEQYTADRERRIQNFLTHVEGKRERYIQELLRNSGEYFSPSLQSCV